MNKPKENNPSKINIAEIDLFIWHERLDTIKCALEDLGNKNIAKKLSGVIDEIKQHYDPFGDYED